MNIKSSLLTAKSFYDKSVLFICGALLFFCQSCAQMPGPQVPTTGSVLIGSDSYKVTVAPVGPPNWKYIMTGTAIRSVQFHSTEDLQNDCTITVTEKTPPATSVSIAYIAPTDPVFTANPASPNGVAKLVVLVECDDATNGNFHLIFIDTSGGIGTVGPVAGPKA